MNDLAAGTPSRAANIRPRLRSHLMVVSFILGVGALYLHPIFGPGVLISGEHPFYFALVTQMAERSMAQHGLVGWFHDDFGGFPAFSPFVPAPLSVLAIVLVSQITTASLTVVYKAVVFLSYVLPAFAIWVALSARVDRLAAFGAVGLYLALTYHLLHPLQGLWMHYLALGLLILLLHYCDRWLNQHLSGIQAAGLGLLTAVTALTDALTWPLLAILIPFTVLYYHRNGGLTGRALLLSLGAFGVAGAVISGWIGSIVVGQMDWGRAADGPRGGLTGLLVRIPAWVLFPGGFEQIKEDVLPALRTGQYTQGVRLLGQLAAEHLVEGMLFVLAVWGVVGEIRRRGEQGAGRGIFLRYVSWVLAVVTVFLIGPWHFVGATRDLPGISAFRQERFVWYVNTALLIMGAYGLQRALRWFGSARGAAIAVVMVLAVVHGVRYATYTNYVALKTSEESVIYDELVGVWNFVRERVPASESRVLYEELEGIGFLDGGYTNLTALSTAMTGVGSITTQRLKTTFSLREPAVFPDDNPLGSIAHVGDLMRGLNCSYLVVWHPMIIQKLLAGGEFTRVYESRHRLFSVLQLNDDSPQWVQLEQGTDGPAKLVAFQNEHLTVHLHNSVAGNRLRLKIGYHPWWTAHVNGQTAPLTARDRMMDLAEVPEGDVVVELFFRPRGGPYAAQM